MGLTPATALPDSDPEQIVHTHAQCLWVTTTLSYKNSTNAI